MTVNLSKADLRAAALAKRDALSDEQRAIAAEAMAKRGLPFTIEPGLVVSGYSPIRSEIDPVRSRSVMRSDVMRNPDSVKNVETPR